MENHKVVRRLKSAVAEGRNRAAAPLVVRLDHAERRKLDALAQAENTNVSDLVRKIVRERALPMFHRTVFMHDNAQLAFVEGAHALPVGAFVQLGQPNRDFRVKRLRFQIGSRDATVVVDLESVPLGSAFG